MPGSVDGGVGRTAGSGGTSRGLLRAPPERSDVAAADEADSWPRWGWRRSDRHKGAIGVHNRTWPTRPEPSRSSRRRRGLAERHGLRVEPGEKRVGDRASGMGQGRRPARVVTETGARRVGRRLTTRRLPAFEAVRALRDEGLPRLLVCSSSTRRRWWPSPTVLEGTAGVAEWLGRGRRHRRAG